MPAVAHPFAQDNINYLTQGLALLADLSGTLYTQAFPPIFDKGIGSHFRHILDHYGCFLDGIQSAQVDYDARSRELAVERDPARAAAATREVIGALGRLPVHWGSRPLTVRMDCGGGPDEVGLCSETSIQRELQFLVSHTVHHYALVAVMLRLAGRTPPDGFGVSPSTLHYLETVT